MKRFILLSYVLLASQLAIAQWFGQNTIKGNGNVIQDNRSIAKYDQIEMSGFFDVELISGTEGSLTITGEENLIPHIVTKVKGKTLTIETEKGYNLQPSKRTGILVRVPFERLTAVTLTGSGNIYSKDVIASDDLHTELTGSGDIALNLNVQNLETSLVGSGDVELQGNAQKVAYKLSGSGDIEALTLKAVDVQVNLIGSGDISLHCDGTLQVKIAGSGDVTYSGTPTQEHSKISGSGEVSPE